METVCCNQKISDYLRTMIGLMTKSLTLPSSKYCPDSGFIHVQTTLYLLVAYFVKPSAAAL